MVASKIDFSAQFGGVDAAASVLPHFKMLKKAAGGLRLQGFPYPKLAFILRVDGEINKFGFSGSGYPAIDKRGKYLSIDIGLQQSDRDRIDEAITEAILSSVDVVRSKLRDSNDVDFQELEQCLVSLCVRYKEEIARSHEANG
jgi:hypothetical protein